MKLFLCTAFMLFFSLIPLTARAQDDQRAPAIAKAEDYLQGLTTVRSHFIQTNNDGKQVTGTFYLDRPGRLRFEYDPPVKDFVVADGTFIYFYDGQLNQQSNAPIGQTLADFLLRKKLKLSGEVTVSDLQRSGGLLLITLAQTADPGAGALTLAFTEDPMQLRKWRVVDATGNITEVELTDAETGISLPSNLFVYKNPAATRHYNQ